MTLLVNHFSTSFWEVLLMPAIRHPSTRAPGLLTPLQKQLLDYHSTINLAGCSRLLHLYRFVSIKYQMLVTPDIPDCLPSLGLRHFSLFLTIDFYSWRYFPIITALPLELPGYIQVGANYLKKLAARVGFEPTLSWVWQKTDYCCSFHTFWMQKCYPPSMLSVALYSHFLYPP